MTMTESKQQWTYETLVEECKRLRSLHEQAEARFFLFLLEVERHHDEVWRGAGCADFEQFLRSNTLCKPHRYRFFAIGVERSCEADALKFGAPWTIQLGEKDLPAERRAEFAQRAAAFVDVNHVAPSQEVVRGWGTELRPDRAKPHGTIAKASLIDRLRAENARLKAEVASLRKRVAELEGAATVAAE